MNLAAPLVEPAVCNGREYSRILLPCVPHDIGRLPLGFEIEVIPPKVAARGYESLYREQKLYPHVTVAGVGKIGRLRRKKKTW